MRLVLIRAGAVFLALIGISLYYELFALQVANGFSQLKDGGLPLALIFIIGLMTVLGGAFVTTMAFMSQRTVVVLLSSLAAVIALSPFMGAIAQEIALKGAK